MYGMLCMGNHVVVFTDDVWEFLKQSTCVDVWDVAYGQA